MDLTKFRAIGKTAAYNILIDEGNLGLVLHELFIPGGRNLHVQATIPHVKWREFYWRADWPVDTLVRCIDVGNAGSWWRYTSAGWAIDRDFVWMSTQGSIASQVSNFNNTLNGFHAFPGGSFQTPRFFYGSNGRRHRARGRILHGSGTMNAPHTAIRCDGVELFTFAWDSGMREQPFDVEFTLPDDANVTAGANRRAFTSTNLLTYNVGIETTPVSTDSATFANLENIVHTWDIGVSDTGTNNAKYALLDFRFTSIAS